MANESVNRQVNIFIESGQAQKVYDTLIAKQKNLNDQLAKTTDPKQMKSLQDQLTKLSEPISRAAKKLSGELAPSLRDSQALAKQLNNELSRGFDPKKAAQLREVNTLIKQQKAEINGLSQAQNSMGNSFTRAFDTAKGFVIGTVITKAAEALHGFFSGAIEEAVEAEEKSAKFKATLENLGRSDAFERLTQAAVEMQKKFRFLDNDDIVAVFNKLIDFGKLTEKQIKQITPVIIDFAAKQKISLADATSVITKALAGNAKGLKEYGIDIKNAKTETERFGVIMTTLKDKVNGAGEAFQNTAAGGIAVAKQQFKDLQEEVGTGLIPVLNLLLRTFNYILIGAVDVAQRIKIAFSGNILGGAVESIIAEAEKQTADNIEEAHQRANLFLAATEKNIEKRIARVQELLATAEKAFVARKNLRSKGWVTNDEVAENDNRVVILKEELSTLKSIADQRKLGIDQIVEEGDKLKKILEDYKKLAEELAALKLLRQSDFFSPLDKEVSDTDQKFKKLKELAHGNREKLKQIDTEYYEQLSFIQLKFSRLELEEYFRKKKEQEQRAQELVNKLAAFGIQTSTNDKFKGIVDLVDKDKQAKHELELEKAIGQEKLRIQKDDLEKAEQQEIESWKSVAAERGTNEITVQNIIAKIRHDYRQKERELEIQHYAQLANTIIGYVQQAFQLVQQFAQLQTDKENSDLAAYQEKNAKKEKNLDDTLKSGMITQLQHDREVQQLEKSQEKREKDLRRRQFYRNQALSIVQTEINGAQAAINALTVQPYYVGLALAIAATAATIGEVAFIRGQKPPDFARGGKFGDGGKMSGRSHSTGGNPIIDGNTGRKIAEIEHDEGIINKRSMRDRNEYTVSGTVSQIGSLLNRLHGGVHWEAGGRLVPAWRTAKPAAINLPNIQRYYAAGGIFGGNTGTTSASSQAAQAQENRQVNAMLMDTLLSLQETNNRLHDELVDLKTNGITAYTLLSQQEKQQTRKEAIVADATMRG